MKIVILTSDILDGRIVCEELVAAKRNINAIIYERKKKNIKTKIKLLLMYLSGKLGIYKFESVSRRNKDIVVKDTDNINSAENIDLLARISPDLIIVVGTGKLKREVYSKAKLGAINLHTGILPFYRGADSEFWALFNNEPEMVGVTIHFIDDGLDSGDIILQQKQVVEPGDSYRTLRRKNTYLGSKKINEAVSLLESGSYCRLKQNDLWANKYFSATIEDIKKLDSRKRAWKNRAWKLKSFVQKDLSAQEIVAKTPQIELMHGVGSCFSGLFCLRIDADEYHKDTFPEFMKLFERHGKCVSIFFNAHSFLNEKSSILDCKGIGIDIQSHGFYHYTYKDYMSNRYNIHRAKLFFEGLGIDTKGFVSPHGKWSKALMQALEDEGYEYASEFAYDYLGLPTYPYMGRRISKVLEIPVFPVAPELFFQNKTDVDEKDVFNYYKSVIDRIDSCALPIIIYAHTGIYKQIPGILMDLLDYALYNKKLRPVNMTDLCYYWKNKEKCFSELSINRKEIKIPEIDLLGKSVRVDCASRLKGLLKELVDFERLTPDQELVCSQPRRFAKRFLRKLL
ncbi:MAG: hypothetical protein HZC15_04100 [Candidatus Omnitrophica bacterium]|nr:hypothetical protein [Candidatus Omnitrophota bacterium]